MKKSFYKNFILRVFLGHTQEEQRAFHIGLSREVFDGKEIVQEC